MATAGWEPHRAIAAGRQLRNRTQQDLADALSALTAGEWTKNMVASMETGRKAIDPTTLTAIAVWLDLPYSFFLQGVEDEVRALNGAIPGYLNSNVITRSRIDHELGACMGCAMDRNFHVDSSWDYVDEIPGQTELVISLVEYAEAV